MMLPDWCAFAPYLVLLLVIGISTANYIARSRDIQRLLEKQLRELDGPVADRRRGQ